MFDHTADVGMRVSGPTPADTLVAAGRGLFSLIADRRRIRPRERIPIRITSCDVVDLLADWLRELLYYRDRHAFLFRDCGITTLKITQGACELTGWAAGEPSETYRTLN